MRASARPSATPSCWRPAFPEAGQTTLRQKVASAYEYAENAIGSKAAEREAGIAALLEAGRPEAKRRFPFLSGADALEQPEGVSYLVHKLLPAGEVGVLYGS
jgi:hypothetical protein